MKLTYFSIINSILLSFSFCVLSAQNNDPLPSWNEGKTKQSIINFVLAVTNKESVDYVPPKQRIATFDNDGTLWAEQPMYVQYVYAMKRLRALAPQHPEWKDEEPYASILKGDVNADFASDSDAIYKLYMATHAGMSTAKFKASVSEWITKARHPTTNRLYLDMNYLPMMEVLTYLRANGFKTYIMSGGGIDFIRTWAEKVYGIPPEQVIGSVLKTKLEMLNGKPVLQRLPEVSSIYDKEGKVSGINTHIGRRPIMAFGNSDGDLQMLQWVAAGEGARLAVYVHHTDNEREWSYDRNSNIGRLDKGLDEAQDKGWTIINMKQDWKTIYPLVKK